MIKNVVGMYFTHRATAKITKKITIEINWITCVIALRVTSATLFTICYAITPRYQYID